MTDLSKPAPGVDYFSKHYILGTIYPNGFKTTSAISPYSAALKVCPYHAGSNSKFKYIITDECGSDEDLGITRLQKDPICFLDIKISNRLDFNELISILDKAHLHDKFYLHISNILNYGAILEHLFEVDYLFELVDYFSNKVRELHIELSDKIIINSVWFENEQHHHPDIKCIQTVTINRHNDYVSANIDTIKKYAFLDNVKSLRVAKEMYHTFDLDYSFDITTVYRRIGTDFLERLS